MLHKHAEWGARLIYHLNSAISVRLCAAGWILAPVMGRALSTGDEQIDKKMQPEEPEVWQGNRGFKNLLRPLLN